MIVCPLCEHAQPETGDCEICGKRLAGVLGTAPAVVADSRGSSRPDTPPRGRRRPRPWTGSSRPRTRRRRGRAAASRDRADARRAARRGGRRPPWTGSSGPRCGDPGDGPTPLAAVRHLPLLPDARAARRADLRPMRDAPAGRCRSARRRGGRSVASAAAARSSAAARARPAGRTRRRLRLTARPRPLKERPTPANWRVRP